MLFNFCLIQYSSFSFDLAGIWQNVSLWLITWNKVSTSKNKFSLFLTSFPRRNVCIPYCWDNCVGLLQAATLGFLYQAASNAAAADMLPPFPPLWLDVNSWLTDFQNIYCSKTSKFVIYVLVYPVSENNRVHVVEMHVGIIATGS